MVAGRSSDHARRAYSFGTQADAYDEHRAGYPEAAVRWALEPLADRWPLRVLDLAAGTGKLATVAVRLGADVVAVEPDPAMMNRLRLRLPGGRALRGTAEQIPLAEGVVDAVLVGQAMHWFDRDRALPEIARVLTPGGVLAALWNAEDSSFEWVAELVRASGTNVDLNDMRAHLTMGPHPLFPTVDSAEFSHSTRRDADSLVAVIATHSRILVLDEAERRRQLDQVRDYLRGRPETASGSFDVPLITIGRRAVRR
jgi:SAM-dependent methyltransferase